MNDTAHTANASHRQAWDLIPWVVAGSASEAERQRVHQHAAACADCREELRFHQGLKDAMLATAAPAHDAEPALQRLLARMDAAEPPATALPAPAAAASSASVPVPARRSPDWTRYLVAAVVVQALGLATLAGLLLERPTPPADYQTLSRPTSTAASIRMVPATSLSLSELQALLARRDLQIVESSADAAILGLAPRPGSRLSTADALAGLRVEPGVLLAEPIEPAPEPRP